MQNFIQIVTNIISAYFMVLILSTNVFCQPDDNWKKANEKNNRYEGQMSIQVGLQPIELISFYRFKENFQADDILRLKFYLPNNSKVYLTAQELDPREYYWMEAKPQNWQPRSWNEFGPWPVADVLERLDVKANNLAILVRLGKQFGSGYISPAILYHSSLPAVLSQYKAVFRPGRSLAGGKYAVYKANHEQTPIAEGQVGRQMAGVYFPIRFELSNKWQGMIKFKIEVNIKNEISPVPPSKEYFFYHNQVQP